MIARNVAYERGRRFSVSYSGYAATVAPTLPAPMATSTCLIQRELSSHIAP